MSQHPLHPNWVSKYWQVPGTQKTTTTSGACQHETYPSHHVPENDHEILHHVASDCHLLDVVVIHWQIVLIGAIPQHLVRLKTSSSVSANFGAGMWLSLFVVRETIANFHSKPLQNMHAALFGFSLYFPSF